MSQCLICMKNPRYGYVENQCKFLILFISPSKWSTLLIMPKSTES